MLNNTHTVPRILVVEENPLLRQLVQTMIHILGAKAICTNQASDALDAFQQGVDIVILDLGLPQISSFDLTRQLRAHETSGKRTPIIGHATVANPEEVELLCISVEIDELVPKLTSVEEMFLLLSKWLKRPFVMPIYLLDVYIPPVVAE